MPNQKNHVVFDLDGTLINSKEEILRTYQQTFAQYKPEAEPDLTQINFGASLTEVLKSTYGMTPDKLEKAKLLFSSIYDSSDYSSTPLYSGVIETLTYLKEAKYKLYIATNKRFKPTLKILEAKNMFLFFDGVMASDIIPSLTLTKSEMVFELKREFGFSSGYMVGDTTTDIQAGKEQGLDTIGVTYGYENNSIFAAQKPTFIIDSFGELTQILKGNIYEAK